jgi:hypothetical protein
MTLDPQRSVTDRAGPARFRAGVAGLFVQTAALALSGVGRADPSPPPANATATQVPSITVIAPERPPPAPSPSAVHDFVRSHAVPTHIGQLARWETEVCPKTVGLSPDQSQAVLQRIIAVAKSVGAPAGAPGKKCRVNLAVVVTDKPQGVLDYIKVKQPALLGYHYVSQVQRIATVRYPIQAWYITGTRGSGGELVVDDSCCISQGGRAGSRLSAGISSEFAAVLVVADAATVAKHDINEIGDYVAVLSLSEVDLSRPCGEIDSIIDALSASCGDSRPATAVTKADSAFLKGLYATDPTLFLQRSGITTAMKNAEKGG